MSREIKFRVYDKKEKCYSDKAFSIDQLGICYVQDEDGYWEEIDEERYIIEQYTGLTDKNDQEVYEGDIVEEDIDFNSKMTDGTFRYKVYWNDDELCWSLDPIGPESIHNDLWELDSSCRVIGNSHENKELWSESV